jgi:arylsulfatase A-like enzyme
MSTSFARCLRGTLALVLAGGLWSCQQASQKQARPDVLLITFDTLRADFLPCYSNPITHAPTFQRLARSGVVFERAYATVPFTPASVWSILYAEQVHGHTYEMSLKDHFGSRGSIAERFHAAGYLTAAVVGTAQLKRGLGFDRGFDHYLDTYSEPWLHNETTLTRVLELAEGVIQPQHGRRPYFLYVHFFDPHGPWGDAPSAFRTYAAEKSRFARLTHRRNLFAPAHDTHSALLDNAVRAYTGQNDLVPIRRDGDFERLLIPMYRSEITWSDDILGRLLQGLKRLGLQRNAVIVISSDHGTAFAEHYQLTGYVFSLFPETLHVPLILLAPGLAPTRVSAPVSLLDLGPTLLDLAGVTKTHAEGRSLRPLILGQGNGRPVYAETTAMPAGYSYLFNGDDRGRYAPGVQNAHATLIEGRYKIIQMPSRRGEKFELFDLGHDPRETVNLFDPGNREHVVLEEELLRRRREGIQPDASKRMDPEAEERLRALGYLK